MTTKILCVECHYCAAWFPSHLKLEESVFRDERFRGDFECCALCGRVAPYRKESYAYLDADAPDLIRR